jgi:hypothetical protein
VPLCKSLYICQWSLFWVKKKVRVFNFEKISILKLLDHTVYVY